MVVSRHTPEIGLRRGHGALVAPEAVDAQDAWMKQRIANTLGVPRFRALVRRQTPTSCLSVLYFSIYWNGVQWGEEEDEVAV